MDHIIEAAFGRVRVAAHLKGGMPKEVKDAKAGILRSLETFTIPEVAAALGISESAAMTRISRLAKRKEIEFHSYAVRRGPRGVIPVRWRWK